MPQAPVDSVLETGGGVWQAEASYDGLNGPEEGFIDAQDSIRGLGTALLTAEDCLGGCQAEAGCCLAVDV